MNVVDYAAVIEQHRDRLMAIQGVVGVGLGLSQKKEGQKCILVYVDPSFSPEDVPNEIDRVPVEVIQSQFRAL